MHWLLSTSSCRLGRTGPDLRSGTIRRNYSIYRYILRPTGMKSTTRNENWEGETSSAEWQRCLDRGSDPSSSMRGNDGSRNEDVGRAVRPWQWWGRTQALESLSWRGTPSAAAAGLAMATSAQATTPTALRPYESLQRSAYTLNWDTVLSNWLVTPAGRCGLHTVTWLGNATKENKWRRVI